MSSVSIPSTLKKLAQAEGTTCESGAVRLPNASGAHVALTGCGPLPGCCQCSATAADDNCVDAPLCTHTSNSVSYTRFDTSRSVSVRAEPDGTAAFVARAHEFKSLLAEEMSCERSWLRRNVGRFTSLKYRNGSAPLRRFSEALEFGVWQLDGASEDENRRRLRVAQDAYHQLYASQWMPLVHAFNAGPQGALAVASI